MKITYDSNARAVYIDIYEDNPSAIEKTTRLARNVFGDYDCMGLRGIEVLNVDKIPMIEDITNIGVA